MSAIKETRGSIMIAALIIALITGSLVGLFLTTVTSEVKNSHRARMAFQAINIAEAGLEYAMYGMIHSDWTGWTQGSDGFYRDNFTFISSYTQIGEARLVKVYIEPARVVDGETVPAAIAEATIRLPNGMEVTRQVYVELTRGTDDDPRNGGFWGNGILGKRGITLGGNKHGVDSFHSGTNPANYTDIADIYGDQVVNTLLGHKFAGSNIGVASNSIRIDDIVVGNADIYGNVATGASEAGTDVSSIIGPNGSLYGDDTTMQTETFNDGVDSANIAYDFFADLPDVETPTLETPSTEYTGTTMGVAGEETEYQLSTLDLPSSTSELTIQGDVILVVDGDITIRGTLTLAAEATLEIYVSGNMDVGGNGLVNEGIPEDLLIFNTHLDDENPNFIKLHGTAPMSAAVYAPNTDVSLKGGGGSGTMYGAIVANSVTFTGNNYSFHYDEALADLADRRNEDDGEDFIPEVNRWVELTDASERKNMATILTDGL